MKATGMIRKVDELGRIVLPIEMRRSLDIEEKDSIEIYVEGDSIILRKRQDSCVFCGAASGLIMYKDRTVCPDCLENLKALS